MRYALFVLAVITFFSMAVLASPSRRVMANLPRSTEFPESTKRQASRSDVIANMRKRALEAKKGKRVMVPQAEERREASAPTMLEAVADNAGRGAGLSEDARTTTGEGGSGVQKRGEGALRRGQARMLYFNVTRFA